MLKLVCARLKLGPVCYTNYYTAYIVAIVVRSHIQTWTVAFEKYIFLFPSITEGEGWYTHREQNDMSVVFSLAGSEAL